MKGVDLRTVGSGNIGATNVARALGKGWAIAVLLGDAAKGFVPVWLGRRLGFSAAPIAIAGLSAIVGHMFTLFLRGRGGKGVATSLGVALALSPMAALLGFGVYVVVFAATRLSSLGSLLGVWTFSLFFVFRYAPARPARRPGARRRRAGDAAPPPEHRPPPPRRREAHLRAARRP